jgi:hypothetical protein
MLQIIPILMFSMMICLFCFCYIKSRDTSDRSQPYNVGQARHQIYASRRAESARVASDLESQKPSRYEQMLTSFYFQTVLPDKSNTTPETLKNEEDDTGDSDTNFMSSSFRRLRISEEECSICLQGYTGGQAICTSKNKPSCQHIFHRDCLEEWLKDHDNCPLCRANLLQETIK